MKTKLLYLFLFVVGLSFTLTTCSGGEDDGRNDVEEVIFNPDMITLFPGDTENLTFYTEPYASDDSGITFTSSNNGVATVDAQGTVTAVAPGTAIITATAKNGVKGTCNVVVQTNSPKQMIATIQFTSDTSVNFSLTGSGTMTIDWGDGTDIETHQLISLEECNQINPLISPCSYRHTYYGASTCSIKITAINISNFSCSSANLTSLDVSDNSALQGLYCSNNSLTNITLGANPSLLHISCYQNLLTSLDVSKATSLTGLSCSHNQLTELDVSKNINLEQIHCLNNKLSVEALNRFFGTLHNKSVINNYKDINITGNPGTDNCDRSIAEKKGWTVFPRL